MDYCCSVPFLSYDPNAPNFNISLFFNTLSYTWIFFFISLCFSFLYVFILALNLPEEGVSPFAYLYLSLLLHRSKSPGSAAFPNRCSALVLVLE